MNFAIADKKSPLFNQKKDDIVAENGRLFLKSDPSKGETYTEILKRSKMPVVETEVTTNISTRQTKKEEPNPAAKKQANKNGGSKDESENNPFVKQEEDIDRKDFAYHSFGAYFVKVKVDSLTGKAKVEKIVSVMDVGRILNEKTAKSQIMGGAIFGIGMALMEESVYDPNTGRIVTKDLAEYHLPVHADIPEFDIQFTDKPDLNLSLIGARGAGEIGITGITAAIVNAVYHATGKRVREIPITPDKLIS
jgi:xanthine dehydrogenase YagR molybdenum-binding subunit